MNEIIITGNVGADPELKMVKDTTLAEFSFAHTPYSKTKGEGETIWFKVTFWNSKADSVMDNIRKGDRIIVIGEFTESKWEKAVLELLAIIGRQTLKHLKTRHQALNRYTK